MNRDSSDGGFTEREMRLIFERAGEAGAEADGDRRYSLAEVQDIALQAGLDANDIARAAATLRGMPKGSPVFGAPVRFRSSRTLARALSEDEILSNVLRVRAATGLHGELKNVPGGMEWRGRWHMGEIIIDFAGANNRTRVDVLVARTDQAALTVMGTMMGGIVAGLLAGVGAESVGAGGAAVFAAAVIAGVGSAWLGTRLIWSRVARRWARETERLTQAASETPERQPDETGTP